MKVNLVGYTQPAGEFTNKFDTALELVAFCARVSNPNNQFNNETAEKLIRYLVKHKHWSPLEMSSVTMEIETTRDIARQMLRHRSFSFQEFSQRYADPAEFGEQFVLRECRMQDYSNRQNSVPTDDQKLAYLWEQHQKRVIEAAQEAYEWAVHNGIAKEQARAVLPEGNTKSRLYMNGTLRSWIHFIELRSGNGTQKEHMEVAKACAEVIADIFPMAEEFVSE